VPPCLLATALAGIALAGDLRARPALYLTLHAFAFAFFLVAARAARLLPAGNGGFVRVVAVAAVLRALLVAAPPSLSEDVYRHLWDGRVQLAGVNPYLHPPEAPALQRLRDANWEAINHKDIPTIYPPLQQLCCRAVAAISPTVVGFKVAFCAVDVALILLLARLLRRQGRGPAALVLYAWNPLVVVEVAASGHGEPLAAAFVILALSALLVARPRLATLAWGGAVLTKIWPLVLAPVLWRRVPTRRFWPALVLIGALLIPFASAGRQLVAGLGEYGQRWQANELLFGGILRGVEWLGPTEALKGGVTWVRSWFGYSERLSVAYSWTDPQHVARALTLLLLAAVVSIVAVRERSPSRAFLLVIVALLLLSPTVHPWYLLWAAPLLPLHPSRGLLVWTALAPLAYLGSPLAAGGSAWAPLLPWLEYLPVLAGFALDLRGGFLAIGEEGPALAPSGAIE